MPDPLQQFEKKTSAVKKDSADYQAEADRLRDELARAKAEREAKMEELKAARTRAPPPPPPPTLSFRNKK
jgi:septal ring factor EnvC (AmiA/AmiB activator)